jgi:O-antigen ligase
MPVQHSHRTPQPLLPGETTFHEKAAVVLIAAIPMLAMAGYGAVDVWSLIPLSVLTIILLVLWTTDGIKRDEFRFSGSSLQIPLLTLIGLGCIQLLPLGGSGAAEPGVSSLSLDAFATRIFTIRLFLLFLFFAATLTFLNGKRRVQRIVTAVIIFGSLMAFVGILQKLTSPEAIYGLRPTPQAIPFGPFVNQHHFAAFMEMTIGLTLGMLLGGSVARDKKPFYLIALVLMAIAVVMTGSRGGMVGVFATASFVLITAYAALRSSRTQGGNSGLKIALGAAAVLIAAVGGVLFLSGADPLVRGIGLDGARADVTSGRMHFWSVAWQIFLENPLIGAGFDAFGVAFTKFDTWNGYFRVEQAHNDYLQMLTDGGVLAFACVAAFIFLLFRRGVVVIRNSTSPGRRSAAIGALAGCIGILVHSFFDFPLRTVSNSYFFLLLAAVATVSLGDEREGRTGSGSDRPPVR